MKVPFQFGNFISAYFIINYESFTRYTSEILQTNGFDSRKNYYDYFKYLFINLKITCTYVLTDIKQHIWCSFKVIIVDSDVCGLCIIQISVFFFSSFSHQTCMIKYQGKNIYYHQPQNKINNEQYIDILTI